MTIFEFVREEAAKYNKEISDADIEYVVWEQTGYPSFWIGDSAEECFRGQIKEFFESVWGH